jgi:hypothetical protein
MRDTTFMYIGISDFEWKVLKNWLQGRIHCSKEQADIQRWHWCISNYVEKSPI